MDTPNGFRPLTGGGKTLTRANDNAYESTDPRIECNSNHEVESSAEHSNSPISKAMPAEVASQSPSAFEQVLQKATYVQLLDHVPGNILDRVVAERLKNAPAIQILKWLAEAQRRGYKEDDIFNDEDESFMPNIQSGVDQHGDIPEFRSSGAVHIDLTIEDDMEWMYDSTTVAAALPASSAESNRKKSKHAPVDKRSESGFKTLTLTEEENLRAAMEGLL